MPFRYYIHQRKEFMLRGEAMDFLKHLYATRRASEAHPRLFYTGVGHELTAEEARKINVFRQAAKENFRLFQKKYEALHRSPGAHKWAKEYLKRAIKTAQPPDERDSTMYFPKDGALEVDPDARFDLDPELVIGQEVFINAFDDDIDSGYEGEEDIKCAVCGLFHVFEAAVNDYHVCNPVTPVRPPRNTDNHEVIEGCECGCNVIKGKSTDV